jgi:hypothetical protein
MRAFRCERPDEVRSVARFHAVGLEIILDVVYNHTAEGNEKGPTLSFKGIDNASYYRLLPDQKRFYINDTRPLTMIAAWALILGAFVYHPDWIREWLRFKTHAIKSYCRPGARTVGRLAGNHAEGVGWGDLGSDRICDRLASANHLVPFHIWRLRREG